MTPRRALALSLTIFVAVALFPALMRATPAGSDAGRERAREGFVRPEADGASMMASYRAGIDAVKRGAYAEAVEHFSNSIKRAPNLGPLYLARGEAYRWLRKLQDAITDYDRAEQLGNVPPDFRAHLLVARARCRAALGDYARAVVDLDQALTLEPQNKEALEVRAGARARLDQLVPALTDFDALLSSGAASGVALASFHAQRGDILLKLREYRRAALDFKAALQIAPDDPGYFRGLGFANERLGNRDEAVHLYQQAIERDPNDRWTRERLGKLAPSR